ncbi:PRA1 family protein F1-like [Trifolium pratense]|uniref:PRA1 family protein F1-like n=1 Tax=Trifolium pratense TaxID=57577 RepID=UPI001E69718A|nr:PRA1 family protein F1-like [Trifolium pratense]
MANLGVGTTQRIPTSSKPSPTTDKHEPKEQHEKSFADFKFYCPINIPLTSEAAASRIIRNFGNFGLYYTLLVWIILFIYLIPDRKVSLILLVSMTYVTTLYCLILRSFPNSVVLHKIMDKRIVLSLLFIATAVQMILTDAGIQFAITLTSSVPVVLLHAVLWIGSYEYDAYETLEGTGKEELAPITGGHNDIEAQNSDAV